jgi:hypothetical protein
MPGYVKLDDGRIVPSVTTILGDIHRVHNNGVGRFDNFDQSNLDRLSKIGTLVHCRILSSVSEQNAPFPEFPLSQYPEGADNYCDIAQEMWDELNLDISYPINIEEEIVNELYGFHGHYDMKCRLDSILTLIDLKTSARAYPDHYLQVAAYSMSLPNPPERAMIISVCPYVEKNPTLTAKIYEVTRPELEHYFLEFIDLCEEWHRTFDNDRSTPPSRIHG